MKVPLPPVLVDTLEFDVNNLTEEQRNDHEMQARAFHFVLVGTRGIIVMV